MGMKAILIIDMPESCWDCPLHISGWDDDFEEIMICNATKLESHYGKIPSYCPLKPLPKHREEKLHYYVTDYEYEHGLGEEE